MKNVLTIVIPSKNEKEGLYQCIGFLAKQSNIKGTTVIIADSSDDEESLDYLRYLQHFNNILKIKVIKGGYPAKARLEGSRLVKTERVLFLDADVFLKKQTILQEVLKYDEELVTVPFETENGYNWIFKIFNFQQWLSILLKSPFAIGGFQLWKTKSYWKLGGYDEAHLFAEDYALSKKVKNLVVHKTKGVWTSARRFKKKGILYMFLLTIQCYINRNNNLFFTKHYNYWI